MPMLTNVPDRYKQHSKRTIRNGCKYCGNTELYWFHDLEKTGGSYCDQCDTYGKWVLISKNGIMHDCKAKGEVDIFADDGKADKVTFDYPKFDAKKYPAVETYKPTWWEKEDNKFEVNVKPDLGPSKGIFQPLTGEAVITKKPEPQTTNGSVDEAYEAFQKIMNAATPKIDRETIVELVKEELNNVVFPTRTVVEKVDGTTKELDEKTHAQLADILTDLMAGEHVLMVGPAGTGKSTIAEQAAKSMEFPFYAISLSPMTPASQILGYMQAEGQYVRTLYREAYENGGVFHFDEFDNAHPSVLAVINASLANGQMAFPDQMISRHKDFRCVASANTYGRGPDRQYVGRQQIDAATLDRFAVETIHVDEALETELCYATGIEVEKAIKVLVFIRDLRKNAEEKNMPVVISPRASIGMCKLMQAGKTWDQAVEARVRRGMSDSDWKKLNS